MRRREKTCRGGKKLEEEETITEEEQERFDTIEAESRQIFDPINKTLDMRKRRVTDLKENSRVTLPKPLPASDEAKINVRREKYESVFNTYAEEHCSEDGAQRSNLSQAQRNGLRKLQKRVQDGEIIVMMTDKSGKMAVADVESYLDMGKVHTSKDKEVGEAEVKKTQKLYNGHVSMWLKFLNMGADWEHEDRMRESCLQQSCVVPAMYILLKDHKARVEGQLPATRPVVSGCSGMGLSLSNIVSDVLENIANSKSDPLEVISSEDLRSRVVRHNAEVSLTDTDTETVLIGGDVVALFPSLPAAASGRLVRQAVIKIVKQSKIDIRGLDYSELAIYVRMNLTDGKIKVRILDKIIPKRAHKKGSMPGMTGAQALKKRKVEDINKEEEAKFIHPQREPTEEERLLLFATACEIAVKFLFSNHLYQFGGQTFLQSDGGPIGMRLTMCVARIVMGEWGDEVKRILGANNLKTYLEGLYVDDLRWILSCLRMGWRWDQVEKKFLFREDWREEDEKITVNQF